jgi:hypothetical protein
VIRTFKQKLLLSIVVTGVVVVLRLAWVAQATGNWKGMVISTVHALLVGVGSWLALRSTAPAVDSEER